MKRVDNLLPTCHICIMSHGLVFARKIPRASRQYLCRNSCAIPKHYNVLNTYFFYFEAYEIYNNISYRILERHPGFDVLRFQIPLSQVPQEGYKFRHTQLCANSSDVYHSPNMVQTEVSFLMPCYYYSIYHAIWWHNALTDVLFRKPTTKVFLWFFIVLIFSVMTSTTTRTRNKTHQNSGGERFVKVRLWWYVSCCVINAYIFSNHGIIWLLFKMYDIARVGFMFSCQGDRSYVSYLCNLSIKWKVTSCWVYYDAYYEWRT